MISRAVSEKIGLLAAAIFCGTMVSTVRAADRTFTGGNTNWNNTAAWGGVSFPVAGDNIVSVNSNATLSLNGGVSGTTRTVNDFRFNRSDTWTVVGDDQSNQILVVTGLLEKLGTGTWEMSSSSVGDVRYMSVQLNNVTVGSGTLNLGGAFNTGKELYSLSGTGTVQISGGVLQVATSTISSQNYTLGSVVITGGTLNLNAKSVTTTAPTTATINGLSGAGGGIISSSGTGIAGVSTLVIQSSGTTSTDAILRNYTGTGGTAVLNVTKSGAGRQTFTGASTYSGATTITAGTLVAGNASALGAGPVSVQGTGTLETSVSNLNVRNLTLSASGQIDLNGASTGTVTLAAGEDFTMTAGTIRLTYQGGTYDQIIGTLGGDFLLSGGTIDLSNSSWDYSQTYNIFSGFGSGAVSGILFTGYNGGYTPVLSNSGVLSFSAIPEPSSAALLTLGLGTMLWRRRRSR